MELSRDEYNRRVQDMQEFCIAAGLEHRVETTTASGSNKAFEAGEIIQANFQVYYDGWKTIGWERNPMTPGCRRHYDEQKDAGIRYRVAGDIGR